MENLSELCIIVPLRVELFYDEIGIKKNEVLGGIRLWASTALRLSNLASHRNFAILGYNLPIASTNLKLLT